MSDQAFCRTDQDEDRDGLGQVTDVCLVNPGDKAVAMMAGSDAAWRRESVGDGRERIDAAPLTRDGEGGVDFRFSDLVESVGEGGVDFLTRVGEAGEDDVLVLAKVGCDDDLSDCDVVRCLEKIGEGGVGWVAGGVVRLINTGGEGGVLCRGREKVGDGGEG